MFAPNNRASLAVDWFRINLEDIINNGVTPAVILADLTKYGSLVTRGPVDPAFPGLPGPIVQIDQTNINLGKTQVSGVDLDGRAVFDLGAPGRLTVSAAGTYFIKYAAQNPDGSYSNGIDQTNTATSGVVPRWKHRLAFDWERGTWGVTLAQSFQKHYYDLPATNAAPTDPQRVVGSYELWDLQLRYTGFKSMTLRGGVRNLFDRDPPYSNAGGATNFQGGYDSTYADPRGRFVYLGLTYAFR